MLNRIFMATYRILTAYLKALLVSLTMQTWVDIRSAIKMEKYIKELRGKSMDAWNLQHKCLAQFSTLARFFTRSAYSL